MNIVRFCWAWGKVPLCMAAFKDKILRGNPMLETIVAQKTKPAVPLR
jgi:hypothetical protein